MTLQTEKNNNSIFEVLFSFDVGRYFLFSCFKLYALTTMRYAEIIF